MSATWTVTITPLNVNRKEASIYASRVDDVTLEEQHFHIDTAILNTSTQKVAALDQLWQMHLDYETKQAAIAAYIGSMEEDAKSNLEARENG